MSASAFRKLLSVYVFSYFRFGFEGRMCDLIASFPDHCLSFYFALQNRKINGRQLLCQKHFSKLILDKSISRSSFLLV